METVGEDFKIKVSGFPNVKCVTARVAEAVAITASARVPRGEITIAACFAAANELANQACN